MHVRVVRGYGERMMIGGARSIEIAFPSLFSRKKKKQSRVKKCKRNTPPQTRCRWRCGAWVTPPSFDPYSSATAATTTTTTCGSSTARVFCTTVSCRVRHDGNTYNIYVRVLCALVNLSAIATMFPRTKHTFGRRIVFNLMPLYTPCKRSRTVMRRRRGFRFCPTAVLRPGRRINHFGRNDDATSYNSVTAAVVVAVVSGIHLRVSPIIHPGHLVHVKKVHFCYIRAHFCLPRTCPAVETRAIKPTSTMPA